MFKILNFSSKIGNVARKRLIEYAFSAADIKAVDHKSLYAVWAEGTHAVHGYNVGLQAHQGDCYAAKILWPPIFSYDYC